MYEVLNGEWLKRKNESMHQNGEGVSYTAKGLPIKLLCYEEFQKVSEAFYREKQVQGCCRAKKEALMLGNDQSLHDLSACKSRSHYKNGGFDFAQPPQVPERSRRAR